MLSQVPIETGQLEKHTQSRRSLDSSAFFCGFFTDLIIWKGWNELCRWAVRLATDWGRKRKKIQEYQKWESITTSLPTVLDYCEITHTNIEKLQQMGRSQMGAEFIGRRRWWWWRWQEDGPAKRMMKRGHRERRRESNIHAITEMPNLLKTELGAKARAT